jgi:hypothetical protein
LRAFSERATSRSRAGGFGALLCAALALEACASSAGAPARVSADAAELGADAPATRSDTARTPPADAASGSNAADLATEPINPPADALPVDTGTAAWPAIADYGARGPFEITRETDTGPGGAYDIFRPAQLGAENRKHPIISWANGTLFGIKDYQPLLEHWASHGFVVIAGHTNTTAGGGTHKAALDWLRAENARTGSAYLGMLAPTRAGAAGHSQGGGATIAAGAEKPGPTGLTATLPLMPLLSFESDKSVVMRQTAPMLNINASADDRDPSGAIRTQIFQGANRELVQALYAGKHEDAMSVAMHGPALAWFRWRLMGDEEARRLFYPPVTCGLCTNPSWPQVRYRNTPP